MSNSIQNMVDSNSDLEQLAQVGPVRAMRFRRDTELHTIEAIANAELEDLMQVWSIGPVISKRIKGSAQGWTNELATLREQRAEERDALDRHKPVAVFVGQEAFEAVDEDVSLIEVVNDAFDEADINFKNSIEIGFADEDMGGEKISAWVDFKQSEYSNLKRRRFETDWDKYMPFINPMRYIEDEWLEDNDITSIDQVPKKKMPYTVPLSTIPFDVNRESQVQKWMAPAERTREMVEWADEVVIILDGKYADNVRNSCEYTNTNCTTVFETREDGTLKSWTPPEEFESFTPDDPETVTGGRGVAAGNDLESDDHWRQKAFDTDEDRLRGRRNDLHHADPGGKGVGKNMDRW